MVLSSFVAVVDVFVVDVIVVYVVVIVDLAVGVLCCWYCCLHIHA